MAVEIARHPDVCQPCWNARLAAGRDGRDAQTVECPSCAKNRIHYTQQRMRKAVIRRMSKS